MNLRKYAQMKFCQIQLAGVCNADPETTVLAHYRHGHFGTGCKPADPVGAHACSACHDEVDGRTRNIEDREYVKSEFAKGVVKTIRLLCERGKLKW